MGDITAKGQMFLIAAIVIVASLVAMKANMSSPLAKYEMESLEVALENNIFDNVINELNNTMIFTSNEPQNISENVHDFINFTKSKISSQSMTLKVLYVGIISNSTIDRMNVSVINALDSAIDVNVSIPSQSNVKSGIVNYERWDSNFTIDAGNNYVLYLAYNSTSGDGSTRKTETISIDTKKNRDVYDGFFYVLLESVDATHAQKYQKTFKMKKS
jgi:hypothetical protein